MIVKTTGLPGHTAVSRAGEYVRLSVPTPMYIVSIATQVLRLSLVTVTEYEVVESAKKLIVGVLFPLLQAYVTAVVPGF
jgi:hypothetical protein